MAYQRRKRRFDRKKVVLVERTICILILLALLALAGRWIAGQLSKEDSQKKKQTKTQTDNTAQKEDKTEAENTQTPVYDFVCSDGTLSAEFQQTLSDRAKEDKKVQKILADSRNYPVSSWSFWQKMQRQQISWQIIRRRKMRHLLNPSEK